MYKDYAQTLQLAFKEKSKDDFSVFFGNFILKLKEKGMLKTLPKILKEVEALEAVEIKSGKTSVILKDKSILNDIKGELDKYSDVFDLENLQILEDKTMVGGFILKNRKNVLDKSYKTALLSMYQRLIR